MSSTGRLIGGPCANQTVILGETVEYVTPTEHDEQDGTSMYIYTGQDPETGEHLFTWSGK